MSGVNNISNSQRPNSGYGRKDKPTGPAVACSMANDLISALKNTADCAPCNRRKRKS